MAEDINIKKITGTSAIDTVSYAGTLHDYLVFKSSDGLFSVKDTTGKDGLNSLDSIERLVFSDSSLALDIDGNAGNAAKLIGAVFGKGYLMNKEIVGIAIKLLDDGMSYQDLIGLAVGTDLFAQLAGSHSNFDFVNYVYLNLFNTDPSKADNEYLVGLLDSGQLTQASLAMIAAEADVNKINIDLAGIANTGLEYIPFMA